MRRLSKFRPTLRDLRFLLFGVLSSLLIGAHAMSQYSAPEGQQLVTIIAPSGDVPLPYHEIVQGLSAPAEFNYAPSTAVRPPNLEGRVLGSAQIINNEYVCTYPETIKGHNYSLVLETPIPAGATDVQLVDNDHAVQFYMTETV